jgi:signal transduction histidine kinase/AmiR/NasT family two-component response regulator
MSHHRDAHDLRVLVFAPVGRDAVLTRDLLARASIAGEVCPTMTGLAEALEHGAGAVVLTEEALDDPLLSRLSAALAQQPAWSEVPILLFAGGDRSQALLRTLTALDDLRNVTLLDRPVRVAAVVSTVRAALRARERQYELRDVLVALHAARGEAERANRLKDEFLATLSHELRSPLSAVLNWLQLLRGGFLDSAKATNALEVIDRNTRLQVKLIEDLVDISRIRAGKLTVEMAELDLRSVVEAAIENIRAVAAKKTVALNYDLGRQSLHILGDATRLQQVFDNVLSNAIKFTPSGGSIDVEVRRSEREAVVRVRDTGQGIAALYIEKIFDRFAQVDSTITRRHQGLGLGLTIAQHLVTLHRGRIEAQSNGENRGSTFTVRLPLADLATIAPQASAKGTLVPNTLQKLRVLVVDDDLDNLEASSGILAAAGARVATASSVTEALTRFDEQTPDVVVTDLAMPDRDGFALLRAIRQSEETRGEKTPIICLTAFSDLDSQARAKIDGFDRHLVKPISAPELVEAVASCAHSFSHRDPARQL